jgi:hypothetical protein
MIRSSPVLAFRKQGKWVNKIVRHARRRVLDDASLSYVRQSRRDRKDCLRFLCHNKAHYARELGAN